MRGHGVGSGGGFHAPAIRPVLPEINLGNFVLVFFLGVGPQKKFYSREYTRVVEPDFRTLRIKCSRIAPSWAWRVHRFFRRDQA